ncbi:MAG: hypothetical protein ACI9J3_000102 [Parvicellaceae bacterium]|jgi:hypothetical protein
MGKLLLKISALIILVIISVIGIFYGIRNSNNPEVDFINQRLKKEAAAVSDTTENRLILVGGSNLAFGIDSELIQETTGKNVHNLGLQRGLGMPYMLAEADRVVQDGDQVLFALEYDFFYQKDLSGVTPMLILEHNPNEADKFLAPDDMARVARFYPSFFRIKVNQRLFGKSFVPNPIYHSNAFNEYGDVVSHLSEPQKIKNPDYNVFELDRTNKNVKRLNEWINNHPNVECIFTFPPFMNSKYEEYVKEISALETELKTLLKCKIVGTARLFAYPDHFFFDTVYHLNKEGRKKRSVALSVALR